MKKPTLTERYMRATKILQAAIEDEWLATAKVFTDVVSMYEVELNEAVDIADNVP